MNNLIRLTSYEKKNIDFTKQYLTLFYYSNTSTKKGEIYVVPTILKYGIKGKVLPKLSFKNSFSVKCIEVKNYVPYEKLEKDIWKYSLKNVKDTEALRKSILRRYSKSRPTLSRKELLEKGVAYTILKVI